MTRICDNMSSPSDYQDTEFEDDFDDDNNVDDFDALLRNMPQLSKT